MRVNFVRDNISYRIQIELSLDQIGCRLSSYADKHAIACKRTFLSGLHITQPYTGQFSIAEQF